MKKFKTYKSVDDFTRKVLRLNEYESWLITFKNNLIMLIVSKRIELGMTQSELARKLGTTQSVISRLESGTTRNISIDYLLKALVMLGFSPLESLKEVA